MNEFEDLTFLRGESSIYQYIEKTDPMVFGRILQRFEEGRWDVVGGTYIQPDTNLPSAETLVGNTLFTVLRVPLTIVIGLGIAVLLNTEIKGRPLYRPLFLPAGDCPGRGRIFIVDVDPGSGQRSFEHVWREPH